MSPLILGAFYDTVNHSVGPTLMWVFFLLIILQWIYAMAKYVDSGADDNK